MIVLVIEDEPILRMDAEDMLEEAGFETVEAANPDQAIAILKRRPDIRIVFTDIDMPRGMDGLRLAATICDRWPPIEIVLTSGNFRPGMASLPRRGVFFPKPYLGEKVAAMLQRLAWRASISPRRTD